MYVELPGTSSIHVLDWAGSHKEAAELPHVAVNFKADAQLTLDERHTHASLPDSIESAQTDVQWTSSQAESLCNAYVLEHVGPALPSQPGRKLPRITASRVLGATGSAKRNPNAYFQCKICNRSLSGDRFYERHLQCIACQMTVNSVARSMKVPHAEAKRAYVEAIRAIPLEHLHELDDHRPALHQDAEERLGMYLAGIASPASSSAAQKPKPVVAGGKDSTALPSKRPRRPTKVSMASQISHKAHAGPSTSRTRNPHFGMLLLLAACEEDLNALEKGTFEHPEVV